mmetsp:Transcript_4921/g.10335  ORF Transcript_4921/g.10335 Transcript_4921/m.10335 type:complete len:333 (-) Transcript_4921:192-1190(-)|eukprot:CAMPEP_0183293698 /NCGR_PEP_ID=MMETSP0160_2-20130417/2289_1 /TAXON_ID=2839 ORGANISM="Odontella Sinensis, Strain Grunow 1884" /NCGR_SAMPLE_ID=MMETSP0160_2 /ASSEMBLY_ACC=CAM_ASM_000250 /LENGTH=332 /DNA_ID=CAMNT_0025454857 /DNA_START=133 /DNA_END=1131 /DNA_ORIENTATION=+
MNTFDARAVEAIPADVRMISGCRDDQTSADVSNVSEFQLPDPAGRAGGACTAALLKVLYAEHRAPTETLSYIDVLNRMRTILRQKGFKQIPQLSGSRKVDIKRPFGIVPVGGGGRKRAVLIGINYVGQKGELSGCHNDALNIKEYLIDVQGFDESDMTILLDDGKHLNPTKANIMGALDGLVRCSVPGDVIFVHYSGHGGRVRDKSGDEDDGYDETLIPVDFKRAGQIIDDDLYSKFVCALKPGIMATCLMDCCHSGTVLDLPYQFVADGTSDEMLPVPDFNFETVLGYLKGVLEKAGIKGIEDLTDRQKVKNLKKAVKKDIKKLGKGLFKM